MKSRIFNLIFHGIGEPKRDLLPGEEFIQAEAFFSILDWVESRKEIFITFDDGNDSDYTIAFPALIERGLKAEFFITVDWIGQPGFVTPNQLREMVSAGMMIGSHGYYHRSWRSLNENQIEYELYEARKTLEKMIAAPVENIACPFGEYDRRIIRFLREADYAHFYTSDGGMANAQSWLQARNSVQRTDHVGALTARIQNEKRLKNMFLRRMKIMMKRWR